MNFIKNYLIQKLQTAGITNNEANIEADMLLEYVCGIKKKDLLLNPDLQVSDSKRLGLEELINKRVNESMPIQYIINEACFYGEKFYVNENVLIPRPETELLVEEALEVINQLVQDDRKNISVLDIGTGSGCISIMIAKQAQLRQCKVSIKAVDISLEALEVAKENAKRLNVDNKIQFLHSDLFQHLNPDEKFDIIVSNPPYIPLNELRNLQPEVVKHEPHQALFAEDAEGIDFYKKIIEGAVMYLNGGGFVLFEAGINQASSIVQEFQKFNFSSVKVKKDFSGIDRVISAKAAFEIEA